MIELDAAIVGGGFSGCAVAAHLSRRAASGFALALFEPDEPGRGAAYGTRHREHVLNTRAHQMSLYSDDSDHFVRWLGVRGGPTDFVSRRLYGDYVAEIASGAFQRPRFTHIPDRVAAVRRGEQRGFVVESSSGASFNARAVVLATGNPAPTDEFLPLEIRLHPGYIADPWRFDFESVGGHVLIVGSGLTALDVLVALKAGGHRGAVHVLSRHGRFPEVHANVAPYDVIPALDTHDARSLLRSFRRHVEDASKRGFDWRAVVDAVRPEAEAFWRRLSPVEQRRFERHLRSHWERHRHRAPQQVEAVRREYRRSGRLFSYAGRLAGVRRGTVEIALSSGATAEVRPDWIVNCSGVGRARAMARDPLIGPMLTDGIVSAEPAGLGLRTTRELVAIDASGNPTRGLWIVGPPVRGSRFEATAVPELRAMAEQVSSDLLGVSRDSLRKSLEARP
ncbi:MAG TPA: FAD-dependent oxidoreductase [Candidatus Dormibacteraeota bacterium]|nr:FAD-dependent oxidoreductase [Candidatus Dormibacteraeota bacterium]